MFPLNMNCRSLSCKEILENYKFQPKLDERELDRGSSFPVFHLAEADLIAGLSIPVPGRSLLRCEASSRIKRLSEYCLCVYFFSIRASSRWHRLLSDEDRRVPIESLCRGNLPLPQSGFPIVALYDNGSRIVRIEHERLE